MKKLISLLIRKIPRPVLQRISYIPLQIISVLYRGNRFVDPISGIGYRKLLPYGRINPRANALAPDTLSLERHRLMWLYLKEKTDFFASELKVLHIAPEHCFIKRFRNMKNLEYITADLESPLADVKMDVHDIPFEDNTFDVCFCNHVMEHVEDDIKAMSEIHRVLKPGGWAIIQSPVNLKRKITFSDPEAITPAQREKVYGQNDHVRDYGQDYGDRLRSAGFSVTEDNFVKELSSETVRKYALPSEETIYFCKKD